MLIDKRGLGHGFSDCDVPSFGARNTDHHVAFDQACAIRFRIVSHKHALCGGILDFQPVVEVAALYE